MARYTTFHRGRATNRRMNPARVVVGEVQGHCGSQVIPLLRKTIVNRVSQRRGRKQRPSSVQIERRFTIHISSEDGKLTASFDDLAQALQRIEDTESRIGRIRECPHQHTNRAVRHF